MANDDTIKKTISQNIAYYRKKAGLSQKEFAAKLGAAPSRVSSWETGANSTDIDTLFEICSILDVSINDMCGVYPDSNLSLSYPEQEHIKKYRSLDAYSQETINMLLEREVARSAALADRNNRIESPPNQVDTDSTTLCLYPQLHKIAAAGTGFYFDDIPTDTVKAPYMENADFIIGVNGDSMEPTYSDGDHVYVEKCQIIKTGEIGIFTIGNEWYIKEAGPEGLLSHNAKYPMIPGSENIICVGRVLGKVEKA